MKQFIAEVPAISACLEIGRGSFGKIISLNVGKDSQIHVVHGDAQGCSELCETTPFARPVLKISTASANLEAINREIDIHHRII